MYENPIPIAIGRPRSTAGGSEGRTRGTVTLVQERRFQLVDDSGVAHPYLLAADARFDPRALHDLARSGKRVAVSCRQSESGVRARVATAIDYVDT